VIVHSKYSDINTGESYVDNILGMEKDRLTTSPPNSHTWTIHFHPDEIKMNEETYIVAHRPH